MTLLLGWSHERVCPPAYFGGNVGVGDRVGGRDQRPWERGMVLDTVRVFNKHVLNPVMMLVAGQKYWYGGVIEHTGRRSGMTYARTTERHLRHRRGGSAGMTARLPATRRPTGRARRPRGAGTVRRLPVAGTGPGLGRRSATWPSRGPISARSPTTAIPRYRSSTTSSAGGASGTWASGSRSTDRNRPARR